MGTRRSAATAACALLVALAASCTSLYTRHRTAPVYEMRRVHVGDVPRTEQRSLTVGTRTVSRAEQVEVGRRAVLGADGLPTGETEPIYDEVEVTVDEPVTEEHTVTIGTTPVYKWVRVVVEKRRDSYEIWE